MNKKRGVRPVLLWLAPLLLFLLVLGLGKGAIDGCYYYPDSDLYCTIVPEDEAAADYGGYEDYFSPGVECSAIRACEVITCNVNCEDITRGECEKEYEKERRGADVGWGGVTAEEFNDWCSPGCCRVGAFCQRVEGKWQCLRNAVVQGLNIEVWDTGILSWLECRETVCEVVVSPATLKVCVLDEAREPITEAAIEMGGTPYQVEADGCYEFTGLSPQGYLVKVSATGYLSTSRSISLSIGEVKEVNFTLVEAAAVAVLEGMVTDASDPSIRIRGATVSWEGPTEGFTSTNADGWFEATGLILGAEYIFTITKYGYVTKEKTVTVTSDFQAEDFELVSRALQGVGGTVWIDINGNLMKDPADELRYGARIYVNDVLRGYSQYPDGSYEISLGTGGYEIYATWEDYGLEEPETIIVEEGQLTTQDLFLTRYVGVCTYPNPALRVVSFSANQILGEEKVKLDWIKPCPEVSGYNIYKEGELVWTASPAEFSFIDEEVEWGETYTYAIEAVYADPKRVSSQTEDSITLGDEECEGKYHEELGAFEEFCLVESGKRNTVWSCTNENRLEPREDCSFRQPGVWFCAEDTEMKAGCKNAGECGWSEQKADPFGLYYERLRCYLGETVGEVNSKEDTVNYCYFDYTDTVVEKCRSCLEMESCFGYKSKDACELNNCLGTKCEWISAAQGTNIYAGYENILVSLITEETGHGYCTEEEYNKEDKCGLCGPEAELFENYFCTAEVCSGLGKCFATDLRTCEGCTGSSTCYSYRSELECTGGQSLEVNELGEITLSKDSCGLGRCVWKGTAGGGGVNCVKDGDADGVEDCENLPLGKQASCKRDNQAPTTKSTPEGVKIISQANPSLIFHAKDNNKLGVLGYCLGGAADVQAGKCRNFIEVPYQGRTEEELEVNLAEEMSGVEGETYRLRYYSKDEYFNRENVKETFVFVDTMLPQFEINDEQVTEADTSDLTVFLEGLNEPMSCSFELKPVLPSGATLTKTAGRDEDKRVLFEGLRGVHYQLMVSCEDSYGNVNNKSKEYIFDLERRVTVIHPKGAVREMSIAFEVETLAGAYCELYKTARGERIAGFISSDGERRHKTSPIPGFVDGSYEGAYYVICTELLTQETYNPDYFNFVVDFTRPETEIVLEEGTRKVTRVGDFEEESFVGSVLVSFNCLGGEGFECENTYYCLTEDNYEARISPCYKEFTGSFTINDSTNICYYSVDAGGNEAYPSCGKILIDGFGITLVKPEEYYYLGEKWGISNKPVFDWEIRTRVPTQECKFDFIEQFNYNTIPGYRILLEGTAADHYLFEDFPGDIISSYPDRGGVKTLYVKCKDLEGEIGPAQKINLEYDPSAPKILEAYAEPDLVTEGIETTLYTETDDKTLCKYSDDSEGLGSSEYDLMEYSFPGEDTNDLKAEHEDILTISFVGANKTYNLKTQCKNGADNLSEVEGIVFEVDYSVLGNIIRLEPSGYLKSRDVTLRALTNKNAVCEYGGEFFEATGGTEHMQFVSGLSEGEHIYLVHCRVGEQEREGEIKFTVDLTPPRITEIDDGNISCNLGETPSIYVFSNEEAIASYYYELYDKGNATFGAGTLVKEGTADATVPFKVSFDLNEGHTYYFKIKAEDAAGNLGGTAAESDGFLAVPSSYDKCKEAEAPEVSFVINESCTKTTAEMHCADETGCDVFEYGKSFVSDLCDAAEPYAGQKVLFEKTGWICYYVEDTVGNKDEGFKEIEFHDEDGDGIADRCDGCPDTGAGKLVDEEGCASGQVSDEEKEKDADGDGLPDYWERLYNAAGCEFDFANDDSNFDGIYDADEDYDRDNYGSYEEYQLGYDPCAADAPPGIEEEIVVEELLKVPVKEVNVLAWTLFILGLMLILGGSGYLIYYYKFAPKGVVLVKTGGPRALPAARILRIPWKEKFLAFRKAREAKMKARERGRIFGAFSQKSKMIPHVEEAITKKGPQLQRLEELAKKHVEVKKMVKPGLKPEEKGIFAKLESIAEKTKEKKIEKVVSREEAKNIFDKLKAISRKRKEAK